MTTEPVWDHLVSDEYIRALGRVVYESNRLENVAASQYMGVAWMTKGPDRRLLREGRNRPVADLIDILEGSTSERDLRWKAWAQEAKELVDKRNKVTHVIYVRFTGGANPTKEVFAWHARSGTVTRLDPALLIELAQEMLAHRHVGDRLDFPELPDEPSIPGASPVLLMTQASPFDAPEDGA